jgi:hypothetical protein
VACWLAIADLGSEFRRPSTRLRPPGWEAVIQVFGTAIGRRLDRYEIQLGQGAEPARWTTIATERGRQVDGERWAPSRPGRSPRRGGGRSGWSSTTNEARRASPASR